MASDGWNSYNFTFDTTANSAASSKIYYFVGEGGQASFVSPAPKEESALEWLHRRVNEMRITL